MWDLITNTGIVLAGIVFIRRELGKRRSAEFCDERHAQTEKRVDEKLDNIHTDVKDLQKDFKDLLVRNGWSNASERTKKT